MHKEMKAIIITAEGEIWKTNWDISHVPIAFLKRIAEKHNLKITW